MGQAISDRHGEGPVVTRWNGHADLAVCGERAWLFYFTHAGRRGLDPINDTTEQHRSSIKVVELQEKDGQISCDRDKPTYMQLQPPLETTP